MGPGTKMPVPWATETRLAPDAYDEARWAWSKPALTPSWWKLPGLAAAKAACWVRDRGEGAGGRHIPLFHHVTVETTGTMCWAVQSDAR